MVTPSYQQGAFLDNTIRSVLSQRYPRLQYVVQDGGSTDDSVAIIKRYAKQLHAWSCSSDDGQAQAIVRGFTRTDAPVMGWLNSDDMLLPGALKTVGEFFRDHRDVDVVYGHRIVVDAQGRQVGRWVLPRHHWSGITWRDFVPQETLFWRRSIWDRVGGIDTSFRFALDWDLIIRFHQAGAKFVRIPRFLGAFTTHPAQKSLAARDTTGKHEFERIRKHIAPSLIASWPHRWASLTYLGVSALYDWGYRLGLLRYETGAVPAAHGQITGRLISASSTQHSRGRSGEIVNI